jgi:adenine-specific DNA-methyltransferase
MISGRRSGRFWQPILPPDFVQDVEKMLPKEVITQNPRVVSTRIRYMGNKHSLASDVARIVKGEREESPLIDVFAGMCSIASAIAGSGRPVWSNDVQRYAALVAECALTSADKPLRSLELATALSDSFAANVIALRERFQAELFAEEQLLKGSDSEKYQAAEKSWKHVGNDSSLAKEAASLVHNSSEFPYRLCTLTFAHGYFGLRQAVEIDSIRYAIDQAQAAGTLTTDQAKWALLALLQAASISSATPGHFAQYLHPRDQSSTSRIRRQRIRKPWQLFLDAADEQSAFGTPEWRKGNRVHCEDVHNLWHTLDEDDFGHAIVYADPPYGKDQYSRYYHVLETLVEYDYPQATGIGRYRPSRFTTPFSLKTKVVEAFADLFTAIAEREWTLVLSYPDSGLLYSAADAGVEGLLLEHFNCARLAFAAPVSHSTLGGRHGSAHTTATEQVWVAG